jgi:hypothetical protein
MNGAAFIPMHPLVDNGYNGKSLIAAFSNSRIGFSTPTAGCFRRMYETVAKMAIVFHGWAKISAGSRKLVNTIFAQSTAFQTIPIVVRLRAISVELIKAVVKGV